MWAKAWKKGPSSRHELFGKLGIKCRNFRDPNNANTTGVMAEIPDMAKFQELLQSDEGKKAIREDGLKVETIRVRLGRLWRKETTQQAGNAPCAAGAENRWRGLTTPFTWMSIPLRAIATGEGHINGSCRGRAR